jgi:uncharacterized membrane protein
MQMTDVIDKPLTYHMDLSDVRQELGVPPMAQKNLGDTERLISMVGGGLMAGLGISRRTPLGVGIAILGGMLMHRGSTGHCAIYEKLGMSSR